MKRSEEILQLAEEIMTDITTSRVPLHIAILKASRLSMLLDLPQNASTFQSASKYAEQNEFLIDSFQISMEAARDPNTSFSSANPSQTYWHPKSNSLERTQLRNNAIQVKQNLASSRSNTYHFASNVYQKWKFGDIAEGIFESKRSSIGPFLREHYPDSEQTLNSIEQNIRSDNQEDWKNAVVSCRTLIMDIADLLNPAKEKSEKERYINRLKNFVSPKKDESNTKASILTSLLEEVKNRIEFTSNMTQGAAHKDRPTKQSAQDAVLYTYLLIADLIQIKIDREK